MAFAASSSLTLKGAQQAVEAGIAEAVKMGLKVTVAICDAGGHIIAMERMDGAMPVSADVASGKARSAALFARETRILEGSVNGGKNGGNERAALLSAGHILMEGGVPVVDAAHGGIVAACGVSGAAPAEDAAIAKKAIAAITAQSKL
mmetsp:Transcript_31436/g.57783  ORF Transcript_31436/g.57783 Transcript_31436/m.57783 type:complete len:148 (-) Transcript_31436:61-504(-)